MPEIDINLETLCYILNECTEDIGKYCPKLIEKLLKSLTVTASSKTLRPNKKKAFVGIKVLLNLYENILRTNNKTKSELPVEVIIQSIKPMLHCTFEQCNAPDDDDDDDTQCDIISIVSLLYKNIILQNSQEYLEQLTEFYNCILTEIKCNQECKTDCLIYKLKILSAIYQVFMQISNDEFLEKFKSFNNVDECQLFGSLVLHKNNGVAIHTLMLLIPDFINYSKSCQIVEVTWKMILSLKTGFCDNYFRILTVLCNFLDTCFNKITLKPEVDFFVIILEDAKYWELVQWALVEKDSDKRKQGMYLLKKTLDVLYNSNKNLMCSKAQISFAWHLNYKHELYKIYCDIITALEFLEEQQVHIIEPFFKMIKTLVEKIIKCSIVSNSWILLLFKRALMHEKTQIVKLGLSEFFELPEEFFCDEYIIRESVKLLVITLNNTRLYYNNCFAILNLLKHFVFIKLLNLHNFKLFLSLLIKNICLEVWSAEALFFVTYIFCFFKPVGSFDRQQILGVEELHDIGTFASTAFKTHNKIIRVAVQFHLLAAVAGLTDTKKVPLETLIVFLSNFSIKEMLHAKGEKGGIWLNFCYWFQWSYTTEQVEKVFEIYTEPSGKVCNEKCLFLLFILSDFVFKSDGRGFFAEKYLKRASLFFKDIDKRLYCFQPFQNHYLSVICCAFEAYMINERREFIIPVLPFVKDILLYIQNMLQQSTLDDLYDCFLYLKTFHIITKTLILFKSEFKVGEIAVEVMKIFKELEVYFLSNSGFSAIGNFWRMKLLTIILESYPSRPVPNFLGSYVLKRLNEPLEKNYREIEKFEILKTYWSKMNSEFIEGKWKILEYSIENKFIGHGTSDAEEFPFVKDDELAQLCTEVLKMGSYEVLCPVMSVIKHLLPSLKNLPEIRTLVDSIWKLVMERRKTVKFKQFIKYFIEMLYQEAFILKSDFAEEILFQYADLIFCETSFAVINIFMRHIQGVNLPNYSVTLFSHIAGKGLIFGPVQKKDERVISQICHYIEKLKICDTWKIGDFDTRSEIRTRAVRMILMLDKKSPAHKVVAENLIETLVKMESEINKNRTRYFGDSHVHHVKHRLMQALLILEPVLNENENKAKEVGDWLLDCLLTENSQPSVRYMQEWLFIRMLLRHSSLKNTFSLSNYRNKSMEISKKGLCSLIGVQFHLCLQIPEIIERELETILYFCFHQHFEVRLYALVVFWKLYELSETSLMNSTEITNNFRVVYHSLKAWILNLKDLKGNQFKNFAKLLNSFYFSAFNPVENYCLETIYKTLPELTNVGSDEWISVQMFEYCGVDTINSNISLKTHVCSLRDYLVEQNFVEFSMPDDEESEEILNNYQKKITPKKLLIPEWDGNTFDRNHVMRQDGLVVVASLIDGLPNLGGLARTCEIFGASEYVVNSLKCTEDKQFISLSVTAEKWITIKEVKIQNLMSYLFTMKQKGYTVIGAEQTLCSTPLNSVKFPKKSLLLLGNEKKGIPPNLLPLLDICAEVPQLGIIRSLNVHVTGALFIWEYAKQNNL